MTAYRDELSAKSVTAHDRPRDLVPPELWQSALSELEQHIVADALVAEIGIGTGAYGGRMADRGSVVIGFDVNQSMIRSAVERWPGLACRLALGDGTALPVASNRFGAVVIAQVLHLVPAWRRILSETARILRPGGLLAVTGGGGTGRSGIGNRFRELVGDVPALPGAASREEIAHAVAALGGEQVAVIRARGEAQQSISDFIDRLEHNPFAWHPDVRAERLAAAAETVRAESVASGVDVDVPRPTPVGVGFDLFRLSM